MAELFVPANTADACRVRQSLGAGAVYVGGGTALQLEWDAQAPQLMLIDVTRLPQAQGVVLQDASTGPILRIGAAMRLETLRREPLVERHVPLLTRTLDSLAALSVRHLATLGGNVGCRWGDTIAALLAHDAMVETGEGGTVALSEALAAPRLPLILSIAVPVSQVTHGVFEKVGLREAFSPTRLAVALRVQLADDRISALAAAATAARMPARRLAAVERLLVGQPLAALPSLAVALRGACSEDLDGDADRARLASRLFAGHLGALA